MAENQGKRGKSTTGRRSVLAFLVLLLALAGCLAGADWWVALPADVEFSYVGRDRCAACHSTQLERWTGSDHDLAMDHANASTVLGDFGGQTLEHFGITSTMFQRDGKYFINTEGPDGEMADFEVKYVFGFEPLQQYMVEFDRPTGHPENEIGRLQVLRVSWDTEQKKWFYLPPPDVDEKLAPDDPLHWTRTAQNWNHMCAGCHSTDLKKNYDVATQQYHTTYSEIDVSCEACHGPGSVHVQLATAKSLFWDRRHQYGLRPLKDKDSNFEIQACAPCHSRRRTVYPDDPPGQDFYNCYANELLTPSTYYPDGQILDEVYVFGSFLQSKMYHEGVRCSDCHDPHSTKLKFEGNAMCVSCHEAHPAGKYDTPNHHRHAPGSPGAQCANCHMPETPYMEVDFRRDHSLRVPRPDLSVDLQTPNACTGCHLEKNNVDPSKHADLPHYAAWMRMAREGDEEVRTEIARVDRWAADLYEQWYPGKYGKKEHFAYALAKAWEQNDEAGQDVYDLARLKKHPGIVRASALAALPQLDLARGLRLSEQLLNDGDPQVRLTAVINMELAPLNARLKQVTPRLQDSLRAVRLEAARVLADAGPGALQADDQERQSSLIAEYLRGLEMNSDLAMSHVNRGILADRQRNLKGVVDAYRAAIRVQPDVAGPRSNLAEFYDRLAEQYGNSPDGAAALKEASRLRAEELPLLQRDASLAPDAPMVQYRYGLAAYLAQNLEEARTAMEKACQLDARNEQFRLGLTLLLERVGDIDAAAVSAERLCQLAPENPQYRMILVRLQSR